MKGKKESKKTKVSHCKTRAKTRLFSSPDSRANKKRVHFSPLFNPVALS